MNFVQFSIAVGALAAQMHRRRIIQGPARGVRGQSISYRKGRKKRVRAICRVLAVFRRTRGETHYRCRSQDDD